jgi:hypothetical protein
MHKHEIENLTSNFTMFLEKGKPIFTYGPKLNLLLGITTKKKHDHIGPLNGF